LLDRFPVQLDGVRIEDEAAVDYLDKWHERDYTALGYQVVRVPVLPPDERLAYLLERLPQRGLD
jgi:predicted ATPase